MKRESLEAEVPSQKRYTFLTGRVHNFLEYVFKSNRFSQL